MDRELSRKLLYCEIDNNFQRKENFSHRRLLHGHLYPPDLAREHLHARGLGDRRGGLGNLPRHRGPGLRHVGHALPSVTDRIWGHCVLHYDARPGDRNLVVLFFWRGEGRGNKIVEVIMVFLTKLLIAVLSYPAEGT